MQDSIICPKCKAKIPLTDAISHEIDEKYQKQIEDLQQKSEIDRQKLIELSKKRIAEEKEKTKKEVETELQEKLQKKMEIEIKNTKNESQELKEDKKKLQDQLLELSRSMRKLEDQNREKEIELEKKLLQEKEKIREDATQKKDEEYKLKMREMEKRLADVSKVNEDLKRKLEQGSQEMQGEVLEHEIKEALIQEFPLDDIKDVPKGVSGADIIQVVKNRVGVKSGTIVWETKRTKNWSNSWIPKLKSDQRKIHADIAILVSQVLPENIKYFGKHEGVWVCGFEFIIGISYALRSQLLEISSVKSIQKGQDGKMEILYEYVTSVEFKHRVEAILEAFTNMQQEIEKERRWFSLKWAREEKNLRKVFDTTFGMRGELESIVGKALPQISEAKNLEPDENIDEEDEESQVELFYDKKV